MKKLILLCLFLSSCGDDGPKVTVCLANGDEASPGFDCWDRDKDVEFHQKFNKDVTDWIAMSPENFRKTVEYYRLKCLKPGEKTK